MVIDRGIGRIAAKKSPGGRGNTAGANPVLGGTGLGLPLREKSGQVLRLTVSQTSPNGFSSRPAIFFGNSHLLVSTCSVTPIYSLLRAVGKIRLNIIWPRI